MRPTPYFPPVAASSQYPHTTHRGGSAEIGVDMNKQQVKGAATETMGKVQKNVGRATRNGTQEAKGATRELVGKAQKAYGNAKDNVKRDVKSDAAAGRA